jgi:hypothetical protein
MPMPRRRIPILIVAAFQSRSPRYSVIPDDRRKGSWVDQHAISEQAKALCQILG